MPDTLTYSLFAERLKESFRIGSGSSSLGLELIECKPLTPHPYGGTAQRTPFSLTFRGPAAPILSQRTYSLHNDAMGDMEIFLVPVGRDESGLLYEAIFN